MKRALQCTVKQRPRPAQPRNIYCGSECPHRFVHIRRCGHIRRSAKRRKVTEKNDRAAGICKIMAELLKFGGECMLRWMQVLINCVWISEKIPDDWRRGIILPFWKRKVDRLTCANHRGITLLSIPGKLLALILFRRSVSAIRSRRRIQQAGFMSWRSTVDHIFALRKIIEKCNNRTLYIAFVDFKAAFDCIDRISLLDLIRISGTPQTSPPHRTPLLRQ